MKRVMYSRISLWRCVQGCISLQTPCRVSVTVSLEGGSCSLLRGCGDCMGARLKRQGIRLKRLSQRICFFSTNKFEALFLDHVGADERLTIPPPTALQVAPSSNLNKWAWGITSAPDYFINLTKAKS